MIDKAGEFSSHTDAFPVVNKITSGQEKYDKIIGDTDTKPIASCKNIAGRQSRFVQQADAKMMIAEQK